MFPPGLIIKHTITCTSSDKSHKGVSLSCRLVTNVPPQSAKSSPLTLLFSMPKYLFHSGTYLCLICCEGKDTCGSTIDNGGFNVPGSDRSRPQSAPGFRCHGTQCPQAR